MFHQVPTSGALVPVVSLPAAVKQQVGVSAMASGPPSIPGAILVPTPIAPTLPKPGRAIFAFLHVVFFQLA